jgi:hypothetical protein
VYSQFYCPLHVIVNKIVIFIEEMTIKCISTKRIIVALGRGNMKGLSVLKVFDKANNSANGTMSPRDRLCTLLAYRVPNVIRIG